MAEIQDVTQAAFWCMESTNLSRLALSSASLPTANALSGISASAGFSSGTNALTPSSGTASCDEQRGLLRHSADLYYKVINENKYRDPTPQGQPPRHVGSSPSHSS